MTDELESQLLDLRRERAGLEASLAKRPAAALEREIAWLGETNDALRRELEQARARLAEVEAQLAAAREQLSAVQDSLRGDR